jgi:DNA-binding CsgD family transcriptional regulator
MTTAEVPNVEAASALTPSQLYLLRKMATGQTRLQVADEMHISRHTVKNHLMEAFRRLGVSSLVQAFVKLGWLEPK